jgi:protocatechuate 3,4-dioxygenase alpha subunit
MTTPTILTPSQTVGPFYGMGLIWEGCENAVPAGNEGAVAIAGRVVDGDGPVAFPAGMLELWTAGQLARTRTDEDGRYRARLRRPTAAPPFADGRCQAPHVNVAIFGRGLLKPLHTRLYFPEDDLRDDPVLALVPAERRRHLVAERLPDDSYRFDICLQGADESVFFAF